LLCFLFGRLNVMVCARLSVRAMMVALRHVFFALRGLRSALIASAGSVLGPGQRALAAGSFWAGAGLRFRLGLAPAEQRKGGYAKESSG
jgi:hypothetical protein